MTIGIVGAGNMGRSIATQLGKTGERVVLADRDPAKAKGVVAEVGGCAGVSAGGLDDGLASDVVVLALWYPVTIEFAGEHADELEGKSVVDISNPLDESWTRLATDPSTSSAELLAERLAPEPGRQGVQHDPRSRTVRRAGRRSPARCASGERRRRREVGGERAGGGGGLAGHRRRRARQRSSPGTAHSLPGRAEPALRPGLPSHLQAPPRRTAEVVTTVTPPAAHPARGLRGRRRRP
jgi:hypothetical protein